MITDEKKQWVLDQLTQGDVVVEFTKVNGDYRRMTCTLNENIVPTPTKTDPLTQKKVRAINEEVCIAYDTTANGWRSFRWDNVIDAQIWTPFTALTEDDSSVEFDIQD